MCQYFQYRSQKFDIHLKFFGGQNKKYPSERGKKKNVQNNFYSFHKSKVENLTVLLQNPSLLFQVIYIDESGELIVYTSLLDNFALGKRKMFIKILALKIYKDLKNVLM